MKHTYNIESLSTIQVVEASSCKFIDGALVLYLNEQVVQAWAPGQWKAVWRV